MSKSEQRADRGKLEMTAVNPFQVFDSQVNIGPGQRTADPIKSDISVSDILGLMSEANVARSLIFPVSSSAGYHESNREVFHHVSQYPRQFIGFGRVRVTPPAAPPRPSNGIAASIAWPVRTTARRFADRFPALRRRAPLAFRTECAASTRQCFEEYGLSGIKMHPTEDGYPTPEVLHVLQEHHKPILFHAGQGISLRRITEEIVKPFSFPVILAHMGGFPANRNLYEQAISLAERFENVYLNTSYVFYQYILESAIKRCPTKILFGSDAPGIHPMTAISAILTLNVSDELKQMVFHDNLIGMLEP